jgi:DNA polymerase III sliding clamp (beta) subunit (PCNA family)
VTVSRRQIHRYLDRAAGTVAPKPTVPVLGNVLVVVKSGKLRMRITDLDLDVTVQMGARQHCCRRTDKLSYAAGIMAAAIIRPEIIHI